MADPAIEGRAELPSEFWDNQLTWAALRTIEPGGAQWKYVEWGTGERELYDLISDPYELQSLHDDAAYAPILSALQARRAAHPRSLAIAMNGRFLSRGDVGEQYVYDFDVWGGTPPYSWSSFGSSLPPGLVLDPGTGRISGVPTAGGEYEFDVAVFDSSTYGHAGGQRRFVKSVRLDIVPFIVEPVPSIAPWTLVTLALLLILGGSFRVGPRRWVRRGQSPIQHGVGRLLSRSGLL